MASLSICTQPPTEIDYSVHDGRIRFFCLRGVKMYNENDGTAVYGWRKALLEFVQEQGLDADDGRGLHAFVQRLQQDEKKGP